MATLTVTINTGSGQSASTLNYSGADAQRMLAAFQAKIKPGGTVADVADWLVKRGGKTLQELVIQNEHTLPVPPEFTP